MTGRMIEKSIWEDEFFNSISHFERLVWIGLVTGCADDQGRFQNNPALIRSRIFPMEDIKLETIQQAIQTFSKRGKITTYIADGKHLIQINNWWKYQTPRWAGKSLFPPPVGWQDRERYHGKGNKIYDSNWDSIGGYIGGYTPRDGDVNVNGDGNGNGDVDVEDQADEQQAPPPPPSEDIPDKFDQVQAWLSKNTGLPATGKDDVDTITELAKLEIIEADIKDAIGWLNGTAGKTARRYSSLLNPIKTSYAKRIQAVNGNGNGGNNKNPAAILDRMLQEELEKERIREERGY